MRPFVFWVTGLSGAGKSTVATMLVARLRRYGYPALLFDGDVLRAIFSPDTGHGAEDRLGLAMSYARLCREVSTQGITVVCATVSMFHTVQRWNRENIPDYREIFLRVPAAELEKRDPKGLYAAFKRGEQRNLVGFDLPAEFPEKPDLIIDNHGGVSADTTVEQIWNRFIA